MFRRIIPALVAAVAVPVLVQFSAVQAATSVVYDTTNAGYSGMFQGEAAGNYRFVVEGSPVIAYCVDFNRSLNQAGSYSVVPAASAGVSNIGAAAFIAANHMTLGTPLTDANFEAAATQVAIWTKTNGVVIDASTTPDVEVRTRAAEILAAAGSSSLPSGPADFSLTLSATADADSVSFVAVLTGSDVPQSGRNVSFTSGSGTVVVVTDAAGRASVDVPSAPGVSTSMTATFAGTIPAGAVVRTADSVDQPLVLSAPVNVSRSASASGQVVAAATTSTAPAAPTSTVPAAPTTVAVPVSTTPPVPVAAPVSVAAPTQLPYTGEDGSGGWLLAGAVVLLLVAAAGGVLLRRAG
jgi:LPXTG-motif cell wall-anchored protein